MTVAEQVKVLCVRCGISEAELARRLGKSPQSLNAKLKRNKMSVDELEEIVKDTMENCVKINVPFKVSVDYGNNWYETK